MELVLALAPDFFKGSGIEARKSLLMTPMASKWTVVTFRDEIHGLEFIHQETKTQPQGVTSYCWSQAWINEKDVSVPNQICGSNHTGDPLENKGAVDSSLAAKLVLANVSQKKLGCRLFLILILV